MGFAWIGVFGKSCNSFLPINDHLANCREHPAATALPKTILNSNFEDDKGAILMELAARVELLSKV